MSRHRRRRRPMTPKAPIGTALALRYVGQCHVCGFMLWLNDCHVVHDDDCARFELGSCGCHRIACWDHCPDCQFGAQLWRDVSPLTDTWEVPVLRHALGDLAVRFGPPVLLAALFVFFWSVL